MYWTIYFTSDYFVERFPMIPQLEKPQLSDVKQIPVNPVMFKRLKTNYTRHGCRNSVQFSYFPAFPYYSSKHPWVLEQRIGGLVIARQTWQTGRQTSRHKTDVSTCKIETREASKPSYQVLNIASYFHPHQNTTTRITIFKNLKLPETTNIKIFFF